MAKKEFSFRGKSIEEVQKLSMEQFMEMVPARQRRTLKRGMSDQAKALLQKIKNNKRKLRTHARSMIVVPQMVDKTIEVYTGKEWRKLTITPHMLGHVLGEFALTRKRVAHSSPGVGATRSSAHVSVK